MMEARQTKTDYPQFKEFVDCLSKEVDLACNPISSIQALLSILSKARN